MTHRLIYLIGAPGSGKSSLMANLTAPYDRVEVDVDRTGVSHDALRDKTTGEVIGAELGKRRELFFGTDALPSSVIERAIPWIKTQPYPLLLGEGARLANKRFLYAALDSGYEVVLAYLDHPLVDEWRAARAAQVGREQSPSWVKGRVTASENLAELFDKISDATHLVTVLRGHPHDLYEQLAPLLSTDGG